MDDDCRDLIQGLFTAITMTLDRMNEIALDGQSLKFREKDYRKFARQLRRDADQVATLADGVDAVMESYPR